MPGEGDTRAFVAAVLEALCAAQPHRSRGHLAVAHVASAMPRPTRGKRGLCRGGHDTFFKWLICQYNSNKREKCF